VSNVAPPEAASGGGVDQLGPQGAFYNVTASPSGSSHDVAGASNAIQTVVANPGGGSSFIGPQASPANAEVNVTGGNPGSSVSVGSVAVSSGGPAVGGAQAGGSGQGGTAVLGPVPSLVATANPSPNTATTAPSGVGDRLPPGSRHVGQGGDADSQGFAAASDSGGVPTEPGHPGSESPRSPLAALADSLPVDVNALHQAFDHCFEHIDAMGNDLADLLGSDGAWPWLAGVLAVTTASAAAGYWQRRSRFDPIATAGAEGMGSPWFFEPTIRV
jgi:hypothetical protein